MPFGSLAEVKKYSSQYFEIFPEVVSYWQYFHVYPCEMHYLGGGFMMNSVAPIITPGTLRLGVLPPLSLYIHFPWCARKCPYCDFNSYQVRAGIPESAYLEALRIDLETALPQIWGRRVHTVFIGGGTPSLLSADGMERLLSDVRALLPLDPEAEITMEANPGTFESGKFKAFRDSGINRLSVGIQSFNSRMLRQLGRIHDGDEARLAVEIAQRHFDNFNLDLMYALPSQTLREAQDDIDTALAFAPPHLSIYHLTLEQGTAFAKQPPPGLPDDEASADMQDMIREKTSVAGYWHYEVSAYAQPGRQARHNLNYWRFGDYLGIGPGAHSKISFPDRIVRQMRFMQPKAYIEQTIQRMPVQEEVAIAPQDLGFEFMLNALRLNDGFEAGLFTERTGLPLITIEKTLQQAVAKGLLVRDHMTIRPTELGQRFLNDLQQMFLQESGVS
ncbi:MAG: coproporphyrinogen oxidase-like protein, oxygen-independent [Burkholderiaceae bacterium]|nr:coproporphyrinogen oxidase-like protein, oxygen-independent [Burkholderiaceae bacterium]